MKKELETIKLLRYLNDIALSMAPSDTDKELQRMVHMIQYETVRDIMSAVEQMAEEKG